MSTDELHECNCSSVYLGGGIHTVHTCVHMKVAHMRNVTLGGGILEGGGGAG